MLSVSRLNRVEDTGRLLSRTLEMIRSSQKRKSMPQTYGKRLRRNKQILKCNKGGGEKKRLQFNEW